ncbi:MAG: flagellar biosynthesis protein FlhB [Desulfobulbaceae bacterium]|jgi:flagellar biosynthetic protein FlhB|nr:flagellar biosynthesis protein FlhB [Desulfobulbaceae bacterium]
MAEESSGERTESPTSKRRDDFRKKGQVAQSREAQTAAIFTMGLLFWIFYMPTFWHGLLDLLRHIFQNIDSFNGADAATVNLFVFLVLRSAILVAPLFCFIVLVAFFATFLQIGWLVTATPLMPDLKKLDPISGMGRFFSKRSLLEVVKSMAKVLLIGWLAFSTVEGRFGEALLLIDASIGATVSYLAQTAILIMAKVCAIMIVLAAIDIFFVRFEMEEKMKMTKQEVKEEYKETEGDPHIKAQIRSIQQAMARKRMMAEVPKADVVITNPTHYAVAIRYKPDEMAAPTVIAKGMDILAEKIKEVARENQVPIVENPPVARYLHKLDLGATIPEEMFKAVAEILAHVYSLKGITVE